MAGANLGISRREMLAGSLAGVVSWRGAHASSAVLPIIFVHGNGDTAGLWLTTIWRFESNHYPRDLLFAVDLRYPLARTVDAVPQAGRSSASDLMAQLAAEVARVREQTGAGKVVLVAQSRGGNTVRNYIKNGGGAEHTAIAVLCGAVNHGVIVSDRYLIGSEFNGASAFMRDLNDSPSEVVADVAFTTIRSDHADKYAQPEGRYLGLPGVATGVSFDAPDLRGAKKVVLPGVDHRETGFCATAFAAMFEAITGGPPGTVTVAPEEDPVLTGNVTGFVGGAPTNIGLSGVPLAVWRTDPKTGLRSGAPVHRTITGVDGNWGRLEIDRSATYEFEVSATGFPVTHIFRSAFPRGCSYLHIRPQPFGPQDAQSAAVVYMTRPRGYFGLGRDSILMNAAPPAGVPDGVPSVSTTRLEIEPGTTVTGSFNGEAIAARAWPSSEQHVSVIELTD